MAKFNEKSFNAEAWGQYLENIPKIRTNEFIKSGVLQPDATLNNMFSNQTGSAYGIMPYFGRIGGPVVNYDGKTDISANKTDSYEQGVVVIGRAGAWTEDDFAEDITSGVDFMGNVASQIVEYFEEVRENVLGSILKGIFKMADTEGAKFVKSHTLDLSGAAALSAKGAKAAEADPTFLTPISINTVTQQACGMNKSAFSLAIMHSAVATNLENLNALEYLKYTDANGIQRDLSLATVNGKTVIIDDFTTVDGDKYITYVLGRGAIKYANIGAKVPDEMSRDPKTNGGQTTLYHRERFVFAPAGISYKKASQASLSPTDTELEDGTNWQLVSNGASGSEKTIDPKAIPICRIISKG